MKLYTRPETNLPEMALHLEELESCLAARLKKHGCSLHTSAHETYGIVAEEFKELMDAMHDNDEYEFVEELKDIAVAAIFGIVSSSRRIPFKGKH